MTATIPASTLKGLSESSIATLSSDRREPAWVLELRQTAFRNFNALSWPTGKEEQWKRIPLADIGLSDLSLGATSSNAVDSVDALAPRLRAFMRDTTENGAAPARRFVELARGQVSSVPEAFRERGVEWMTLEEAMVSPQADRLRATWTAAVERAKSNKFRSLTLALANGGSCLFIPRGQVLKAPLHLYVAAGGDAQTAQFPLNFYFLDEACEAQIWEELTGREDAAAKPLFVSSLSIIEMKENAKASFFSLQNWDDATSHFQFQDVVQRSFSRFNAVAVCLGARMFRNESVINLEGQGAENKVLGVLFGERSQVFENWITQNHIAPKTTSDIQYRGALKGSARSFFSGLVYIKKEAQQSDAFQSAKTLLLSREARADAIPNLEILADDVKCSHGAAVGSIDEDQKFYLQTRGINPANAEKAIIEGFFEPVIAEVPSESVQERLRLFVEEKMKRP